MAIAVSTIFNEFLKFKYLTEVFVKTIIKSIQFWIIKKLSEKTKIPQIALHFAINFIEQ